MESRLITYPDIDNDFSIKKFLLIDPTSSNIAILINNLKHKDPQIDLYIWNSLIINEQEQSIWLKTVWDSVNWVLIYNQSGFNATKRALDNKKVIQYNNAQEILKVIYGN